LDPGEEMVAARINATMAARIASGKLAWRSWASMVPAKSRELSCGKLLGLSLQFAFPSLVQAAVQAKQRPSESA
jgi:hypothetical protein